MARLLYNVKLMTKENIKPSKPLLGGRRAQAMAHLKQRYLSLLPDLPLWVETRDLLSFEGSVVAEDAARNGFVIWSEDDDLGSVVGQPDAETIMRAANYAAEILAFAENIAHVRSVLRHYQAEAATIFSAPAQLPPLSPHMCRQLGRAEIASLQHLPSDTLDELSDVAQDGAIIVAAFDGNLPVAFAYVASETETLCDVSIDTLESHRRKGYASAAAISLMQVMMKRGKTAVWGALESNLASQALARHLGFVEVDTLWVLSRTNPLDKTKQMF